MKFWAQVFPKTFSEKLEEVVLEQYGNQLVEWARGKRSFPFKLETLKIYTSKKLANAVAVSGIEYAKEVIKEKLDAMEMKRKVLTLVSLGFAREKSEEILTYAIQNEVADIDVTITDAKIPNEIRDVVHITSLKSTMPEVEILGRNLVRLTMTKRLALEYSLIKQFERSLAKLNHEEIVRVSKKCVDEFLNLVSPGTPTVYDSTTTITNIMKSLVSRDPSEFVAEFDRLLEKYNNSYEVSVIPIVHNVLTSCPIIDESDPLLTQKIAAFKQIIEKSIEHNVSLRAIKDSLQLLVTAAGVFFTHGLVDELKEIGTLYATVSQLYKNV